MRKPEIDGSTPSSSKMIVKLNDIEYNYLVGSSLGCEACEELLRTYNETKCFETEKLTRQQLIHIETTTRRKGLLDD